ncbi:MAG: small acid-soluble spore protein SspI [Hydrogenibacillus sp.]|nr:small acid-soluble spore protein SspI [Hydrogenibacillus sp.]
MTTIYRDLDLRQALDHKLRGASARQLQDIIEDAIDAQEDKTLPGLGYLFELLWQRSDDAERQAMLGKIAEALA